MNALGKFIVAASVVCCHSAYSKPISTDELLNVSLVGLDIEKTSAKDIYKKYKFDFNASCYAGYSSIYISSTKNRIYLITSYDPINEASLPEDRIELKLISVVSVNQGEVVSVTASSPDNQPVIFSFSKNHDNIFNMNVKGLALKEPDNSDQDLKSVYINIKDAEKFIHTDCGDFDG